MIEEAEKHRRIKAISRVVPRIIGKLADATAYCMVEADSLNESV